MCHCLECQKRTGAPFGTQARFPRASVTIAGNAAHWTRAGESGGLCTFGFCATCGSTVYWEPHGMPDFVSVAVGAFADPNFPAPTVSVYENRMHPWVFTIGELPMEHD